MSQPLLNVPPPLSGDDSRRRRQLVFLGRVPRRPEEDGGQ